jgi:hypothetical protein
MEIELRIPDDYCQGESSALYPLEDDEFYEEDKVIASLKITPRNRKDC